MIAAWFHKQQATEDRLQHTVVLAGNDTFFTKNIIPEHMIF